MGKLVGVDWEGILNRPAWAVASGTINFGSQPVVADTITANTVQVDSGVIRLGPATAAHPMWQRNGTQIQARLADNSGEASLSALRLAVDGRQIGPNNPGDYYAFLGTTNMGWAIGSNIAFNTGGALGATGSTIALGSNGTIGFSATANNAQLGTDTKIGRAGVGIVGVYQGNGTTLGGLSAANLSATGMVTAGGIVNLSNDARIVRFAGQQIGLQVNNGSTWQQVFQVDGSVGTPTATVNGNLTASGFLNSASIDVGTIYNDSTVALSVASNRTWLFNMYNAGGTHRSSLSSAGHMAIGGATATNAQMLRITPNGTTVRGLVVQGIASQTANYYEAQNSAGAVEFSVAPGGNLTASGYTDHLPMTAPPAPASGIRMYSGASADLYFRSQFSQCYLQMGGSGTALAATGQMTVSGANGVYIGRNPAADNTRVFAKVIDANTLAIRNAADTADINFRAWGISGSSGTFSGKITANGDGTVCGTNDNSFGYAITPISAGQHGLYVKNYAGSTFLAGLDYQGNFTTYTGNLTATVGGSINTGTVTANAFNLPAWQLCPSSEIGGAVAIRNTSGNWEGLRISAQAITTVRDNFVINGGRNIAEAGIVFQQSGVGQWQLYDAGGSLRLFDYGLNAEVMTVNGATGAATFNNGLTVRRSTFASYGTYIQGTNSNGFIDWELDEGLLAGYGGTLNLRAGDAANTGFVRLRYDQGYPKLETNQTSFTVIGSGFQQRLTGSYIDWQINSQTFLTIGNGQSGLLNTVASNNKGFVVQGVANQTANYYEARDSAGNIGFSIRPSSTGASTVQLAVSGASGDSACAIGVASAAGGPPTCGFGVGDANTGILTTSSGHSMAWRLRSDTTSGGIISYAGVHVSQQGGANNNPRGSIWCNTSNVFQLNVYGTSSPASFIARAGTTRFVNNLNGTHGVEFFEVHSDGRTQLRHSNQTNNYIQFSHAGPGTISYWSLTACSLGADTRWGTGGSGNSNNIAMVQSSASGADATLGLYAERYADATVNGQPRFNLYAKRLGFHTKSADSGVLGVTVEQAYVDTNGLIVSGSGFYINTDTRIQRTAAGDRTYGVYNTAGAAWQDTYREQATAGGAAISFYGVTPVTRQTLAASPTAAQIATVLANLGLVSLV